MAQQTKADSDVPRPLAETINPALQRFQPMSPENAARLDQVRADADRRQRIGRLETDLGPRYSPKIATLDTYRVYDQRSQRPTVDRLRTIAAGIEPFVADGAGLVLFGPVGTGKDHLVAALLYLAARTVSARWFNGRDVFGESRDRIKEDRVEREQLETLCAPTVLCISDPVPISGAQSAWNIDLLYRVIDRRYHLMRPTWMTLNVRDLQDAEDRLTSPVWDRLRHGAELVPCFWESYRSERSQRTLRVTG